MPINVPQPTSNETLAIEFYSGIGGFAQAARFKPVKIMAAFDQSSTANCVYQTNFGLKPRSRNLDAITKSEIPEAHLWWMSPPCTPFTVRGQRLDNCDPRARSFLNLINLIPQCLPQAILVENVSGFAGSQVHAKLLEALQELRYAILEISLCPTFFGIPMKRPRHFVVASSTGLKAIGSSPQVTSRLALKSFLDDDPNPELEIDEKMLARYGRSLNFVNPSLDDAVTICFTSGYTKCTKASGSFLQFPNGNIRRFSENEILRLLGFDDSFRFPDALDRSARFRLVGNSVDIRAIRYLLELLDLK